MHLIIICDPPVSAAGQNVGGTHQAVACVSKQLTLLGHKVTVLSGDLFAKVPQNQSAYDFVAGTMDNLQADSIHIATQGRLGFLVRRYCVARKLAFTTAYHTQYPEYLKARHGIPAWLGYAYIRWFHKKASQVIVPTPTMAKTLTDHGVKNAVSCLHGVDTELFQPGDRQFLDLPRPIFLFVGKVEAWKNISAFLSLNLPGTKLVVGDGSERAPLQKQFPDAKFVGVKTGKDLAQYYAAADVFVFPSKTDTFGLVLLEALAAGLPVAAYPVTGPIDVITDKKVGYLDDDLAGAAIRACQLSRQDCRNFALKHSWMESAKRFFSFQVPCYKQGKQPGTTRIWLERKCNLPVILLEKVVNRTETLLFA